MPPSGPILRRSALLALACVTASLAAASELGFEGRYSGGSKGYRQELTITKRTSGGFSVEAVVGTDGCSGLVEEAVGMTDGDALKTERAENDATCALTIRHTKTGVSVTENNCTYFHGPSCDFTGTYRKRR